MAAASLPLELQQEIFSYLDSQSFHAARKVCRCWRVASFDDLTLSRQLHKLPVRPRVDVRETGSQELQRLFDEASRILLLGWRVSQSMESTAPRGSSGNYGQFARPRITAASRGSRTVTINGDDIALFDTTDDSNKALLQRPLNGTCDGAKAGPWLGIAPTASRVIALSSSGSLLAVAQERTIAIYDLSAGASAAPICRTLASAAGHYISGVDFEQEDYVLRVRLSGKGDVVYLGTPNSCASEPAAMGHWASKAGLRHTFLDSSLLSIGTAPAAREYEARLASIQLLRPFCGGYLFAAQKHGGGESSHYIYGHIKCSEPASGLSFAAEPTGITELAKLESFLSAWDYALNNYADSGMGSWNEMPCAHEHHPCFSMTADGALLVLAEREKKQVRHVAMTQLFLYRLPAMRRLKQMIDGNERWKRERWTALGEFLDDVEGVADNAEAVMNNAQVKREHSVAKVPRSLGILLGKTTEIEFLGTGDASHELRVTTDEVSRSWSLEES